MSLDILVTCLTSKVGEGGDGGEGKDDNGGGVVVAVAGRENELNFSYFILVS